MATQQPFQYQSLAPSSTRLAKLAPGSVDAQLRCELIDIRLEAPPAYEALSYVWGSEENKPAIVIETERGDEEICIPRNLAAALRQFRHATAIRTIWADSICINQHDLEERSRQVSQMGIIYRQASSVLIWLGENGGPQKMGHLQRGLECLSEAVPRLPELDDAQANIHPDIARVLGVTARSSDEIHAALDIPLIRSAEFQAVLDLLRNPWFSRAWTWQEGFLGRQRIFQYGDQQLPSHLLEKAWIMVVLLPEKSYDISSYGYQGVEFLPIISMIADRDTDAELTFSQLLVQRRGAKCKISSDLIYSLLGAARDCPEVTVDYTLPFERVFAQTMWQTIVQDGDLSTLSAVQTKLEPSNLPTWVPDWRTLPGTSSVGRQWQYNSTGTSKPKARLSADSKVLSVSGIYFDQVETAFSPNQHQEIYDHYSQASGEVDFYAPTKESFDEALQRTVVADVTVWKEPRTRWQPESYQEYRAIVSQSKSEDPSDKLAFAALRSAIVVKVNYQHMIITKKARLGITTDAVCPGDVIAFFLGGDAPYVLRPTNEVGNYTFVSDCYVHGFMDGEALVHARQEVEPELDSADTAWLGRLDIEAAPFPTQEFHLH